MFGAWAMGGLIALGLALPLAWKWELGMRRSSLAVVASAIACGLGIAALDAAIRLPRSIAAGLVAVCTLAICASVVLWRFYRDPERAPPEGEAAVVSPADGLVIYVHESQRGQLPVSTKHGRSFRLDELVRTPLRSDDSIVVGIALNFLDVHVNRAPIAGAVTAQQRHPGRFASLKQPIAVFTNERATTVLERSGLQVAVVLIASRLVRRIVTFVNVGEEVELGQRIGVIRFGSQVDLVLPKRDGVHILVRPGDRVRAGETLIAEVSQ
jgi:phosphatidylserine decarboxylase